MKRKCIQPWLQQKQQKYTQVNFKNLPSCFVLKLNTKIQDTAIELRVNVRRNIESYFQIHLREGMLYSRVATLLRRQLRAGQPGQPVNVAKALVNLLAFSLSKIFLAIFSLMNFLLKATPNHWACLQKNLWLVRNWNNFSSLKETP